MKLVVEFSKKKHKSGMMTEKESEVFISEKELEVLMFLRAMKTSLKFNKSCKGNIKKMRTLLLSQDSLKNFIKLSQRDTIETMAQRGLKYFVEDDPESKKTNYEPANL